MYRVLNEQPDLGDLSAGALRDTLAACLAKVPERRPLLADLLARFAAGFAVPLAGWPGEAQVAVAGGPDAELSPGLVVHAVAVPAEAAPGVLPPAAELRIEQVQAEQHENISVNQQANAAPHSVVIQIAGSAKIGDDMLGGRKR
jgi:hypothetical protein